MTLENIQNAVGSKQPAIGYVLHAIEDGRGRIEGNEAWVWNLTHDEQNALLGLSARYPEQVVALVTHNLNSGRIVNLSMLVSEIRIGN